MHAGYVATLYNSFPGDEITEEGQTTTDGDYEWYVTPTEQKTAALNRGTQDEEQFNVYYGQVKWTTSEGVDVHTVKDGWITEVEEKRTHTHMGEFAVAPSKKLALLSDEAMRFEVGRAIPGGIQQMPDVDVSEFAHAQAGVDEWAAGFAGRIPDTEEMIGVQKGAVYGDDVTSDPAIGEDLRRGYLNQVGIETRWELEKVKAYVAESGYVALYGDNIGTTETMAWLASEVGQHLTEEVGDEKVDEEEDDVDDGQSSLDDLDTVNDPSGDET